MKKNIEQYKDKTSVTVGYARVSSTDIQQELGRLFKISTQLCDKPHIKRFRCKKSKTKVYNLKESIFIFDE